jgi:hypothetical protein
MKSILYILSAIIFCCSTVYAGNFEQVCLEIGYDEDSEKFHACVEKLTARNKPLNKDVGLSEEADVSPLINTIIIQSAAKLATDAIRSSKSKNSGSQSNSKASDTDIADQDYEEMEALTREGGICSKGFQLSSGNLNTRCAYIVDILGFN